MRITRSVLLSDDYDSIIKEFVEKSNRLAVETVTEVKEGDFKINVELNSNGDEA